jgi:hypothetical protein
MKKILSVVVLLTFVNTAWGGAILTVGNPTDNEAAGNLVEVDVTIYGLPTTLASYHFDVDFTPGVLSALATDPGSVDNAGGTITGITGNNIGMNFGGTLFKLYFNAIVPGTDFLSIPSASVILLDSSWNTIPFTAVGGRVSVDGPVYWGALAPVLTPEPGSLSFLLIGMAAMAAWYLMRRRPLLAQSC